MTTVFGIIYFLAAAILIVRTTRDVLAWAYRRGYQDGKKEAIEAWLGGGREVAELKKEMRYEEEA